MLIHKSDTTRNPLVDKYRPPLGALGIAIGFLCWLTDAAPRPSRFTPADDILRFSVVIGIFASIGLALGLRHVRVYRIWSLAGWLAIVVNGSLVLLVGWRLVYAL